MLLYSKPVNFLLTNALLRRLAAPNAFAVCARNLIYFGKQPQQSNNSSSRNHRSSSNQSKSSESFELSQKENVELSGLRLVDACFNALVDLHASDEFAYLDNFQSLHCVDKLKERFHGFGHRYIDILLLLLFHNELVLVLEYEVI